MINRIEKKLPGEELQAAEFNIVTESLNELDNRINEPTYSLSGDDFQVIGTTVVNGTAVPKIGIKWGDKTIYFDLSQFNGDGSIDNPYSIKPELLPGDPKPTLDKPIITTDNITQTSVKLLWTNVTEAVTYVLQRASNSAFTIGLTTIYSGANLEYINTELTPSTQYYYRVQAQAAGHNSSQYSLVNITTQAPDTITPNPPIMVADDVNNTLTITHPTLQSSIVVSVNNGLYVDYTGIINVGDVDRPVGYYKSKIKSSPGFNESSVVESPAFHKKVVDAYIPGFNGVNLTDSLFDGVLTDNGGIITCNKPGGRATTKFSIPDQAEIAIKVMGGADENGSIGAMHTYDIGNLQGINIENGELYQVGGGNFYKFSTPNQPAIGDWVILRYKSVDNTFDVFKTTDGITYIPLTIPDSFNLSPSTRLFAVAFGNEGTKLNYPQGKGLILTTQ